MSTQQDTNVFADRRVRAALLAVFILLALFLAAQTVAAMKGLRFIGSGVPATNTIHVSGEGEVFAVPDIGQFSFSVVEEATTVADAQTAAAERINEAIDFLEDAGVEEKDIKTTGFNVYPRYEYPQRESVINPPSGERALVGFEVRQSVSVKVRTPSEAGDLLSGLAEIGVQEISGLSFTIDDDEAIMAEARQKAIADAKEKAEELADELDIDLVRVVSFSESGSSKGYPTYALDNAVQERAGGGAAPNIPTGENRIVSNVAITYEIR